MPEPAGTAADTALPLTARQPATGRPAGRVILVHGTLDDAGSWLRVLTHLRDWETITYDRRGWGRAAGHGPADLDTHVADLAAIVERYPDSVLAGHSFGGTLALTVADRLPGRVAAVVAFEPPLPWLPWWPVRAPWERLVLDDGRSPADAAEAMLLGVLGEEAFRRLPAQTLGRRRDEGGGLVAEMRTLAEAAPGFDPARLTVPVIAGAGADSLPHHRLITRKLAELAGGDYRELPGAGHPAHVTHPAQFAELVKRAGAPDLRR